MLLKGLDRYLGEKSEPGSIGRLHGDPAWRYEHLFTAGSRLLLDAAHIIPDNMPDGKSIVEDGLSLCKLHHAAYDSFMIGVTPDYVIHVRGDILEEEDGPVLQHGLKGLHKTMLILPAARRHYPSRDALEWRYSRFSRV